MPTNLLEQAERASDARFISQVRSVLIAIGLVANPVAPVTVGEIPEASETSLITRSRVVIRALAEIE